MRKKSVFAFIATYFLWATLGLASHARAELLDGSPQQIPRFSPGDCVDNSSPNCKTDVLLCKDDENNCRRHVAVAESFADFSVMAADVYHKMSKKERQKFNLQLRLNREFSQDDLRLLNKETKAPDPAEGCSPEGDDENLQNGAECFNAVSDEKDISYDRCLTENLDDQKKIKTPSLPMFLHEWKRVPQLDRRPQAKSYLLFVPGLYIEVWRREHKPDWQLPFSEYAIVYRGTEGTGGVISDLHFLLKTLILFHDQYDQAQRAYGDLYQQILIEEEIMESRARIKNKDKEGQQKYRGNPFITLVGHSLGAGLAMHVAMHHKGIHRIVGFNPSFITGFMATPYCVRADRLSTLRRVDFVYENAEVLHALDPKKPLEAIDPALPLAIHYHEVNLSGGTAFEQHKIVPLACRLAVIRKRAKTIHDEIPGLELSQIDADIYSQPIESTPPSIRSSKPKNLSYPTPFA